MQRGISESNFEFNLDLDLQDRFKFRSIFLLGPSIFMAASERGEHSTFLYCWAWPWDQRQNFKTWKQCMLRKNIYFDLENRENCTFRPILDFDLEVNFLRPLESQFAFCKDRLFIAVTSILRNLDLKTTFKDVTISTLSDSGLKIDVPVSKKITWVWKSR